MTRIAALYDIHGNLPALEAVLDEVRRASVDVVVVGGDVIPGPMPNECLAVLFALDVPTRFIMGNGDRATMAARAGSESVAIPAAFRDMIRWVADELLPEHVQRMEEWPATARVRSALGEILFCHATPRNDTEIFTRMTATDRLIPVFAEAGADIVVCGHTHMPFDRVVGSTRVVNAGSVGMPFGDPGAYWLLIDDAIHLRHTSYDLDAAADRIRATRYPQSNEFAATKVLRPPSEGQMLDVFSRAEINDR